MIKFQDIYKSYDKKVVLHGINLDVHQGEFLCLVGESGSGKTTLLRILAGLIHPTKGEVLIDGNNLTGTNFDASMVFQGAALLPWRSVYQNVCLPYEMQNKPIDDKAVNSALTETGLRNMEHKLPRDLSGGQRQRVGIARALAIRRKILLLDEPFSALDIKTASELRRDLLELWKKNNLTVVMVSHLVEEAVELADRIVVMKNGSIVNKLTVSIPRPRNTESKEFIEFSDRIKNIIEN